MGGWRGSSEISGIHLVNSDDHQNSSKSHCGLTIMKGYQITPRRDFTEARGIDERALTKVVMFC